MADHREKLRSYVRKTVRPSATGALELLGTAPDPTPLYRARAKDEAEFQIAVEALDRVKRDQDLDVRHIGALEAIVNPTERPVFDVRDGTFAPSGLFAHLDVETLKPCIAAIGRIEPDDPQLPYAGTGFVASPTTMITNRHVARLFADGVGEIRFVPFVTTKVDLKRERDRQDVLQLTVRRVALVHPYWDVAFLEVEGLPAGLAPLPLASTMPSFAKREVAVIGYPYLDARNPDRVLQDRIFDGVYGVKRVQPGWLTGTRVIGSFEQNVEALVHDASTLGGNSGSCVVDTASGVVLAVHFAGLYLDANFAVPSWELFRDPRVRALDLAFASLPAAVPAPSPDVEARWAQIAPLPEIATGGSAPSSVETPDWYERTDDETLAQMLAKDRLGTVAKLAGYVGDEEARSIANDLAIPNSQEWLFSRKTDPDLPEIVFLHGIMGGHLVDYGASAARVWLNPFSIVLGHVSDRLTLAADGMTDADPSARIQPGGHLRLFYARAARKWRGMGFVVHEHSYDWRKGIAHAADRLHLFLETLKLDRPGRRFALVAHSMGGLVASVYATRHPNEAAGVGRAVFLGAPLGGSFAPLEAVLGTYPFLRKLALVARDQLPDLQRMSRSLPGLLEMLPDPKLFPACAELYQRSTWPSGFAPAQRWLDGAVQIKEAIAKSPLLPRTTLLVCTKHGTVTTFVRTPLGPGKRNGRGDGTVPARASLYPDLPAYEVSAQHDQLPLDDQTIAATAQLLREGSVPAGLPKVERGPWMDATLPEEAIMEAPIAEQEAIAARLRTRLTRADVDWLFGP